MKIGIYPGSFDPITLGHVDIVRRLAPLFDRLIVLVANAENKNYVFDASERSRLVSESLKDSAPNVEVEEFDGLTIDFAKQVGATVIIRGIRGVGDMENEMAMAHVNKKLDADIETLIVLAAPEFSFISSRLVKEVALHGGDLSGLLPPGVDQALREQMNTKGV
ncbi:MAG: pantetheine-phosphate adenylyltransferase [Pseudobdellovibrionaceae bacterium]|nr:pantetheine-phosphate adenylyltransferase [Bdellovibrionales bacterium]USN46441.1 MAG: pantetheine-phosphate adenylyltransferase [Pseudobdellovibrionaceae bacterium]